MLLGARTQMMDGKFTFEEIFRFSKECGVEALEYCCEDYTFHYRPETTEDYTLKHIRELSEKYEIRISAAGNHLTFMEDDLIYQSIQKMLPKIKLLGTDIFILSANPPQGTPVYSEYRQIPKELKDRYKIRLKTLLEIAEDNGIKIAMEPEPPGFVSGSRDMLELMSEMNSEALCINFDIGHAFLTDEDLLGTIREFGSRIVHAHIENMNQGEHVHRLLQEGEIDLRACLRTMKEIGYNGAVAIDLYGYEYDKVLKEQIRILRDLME